MSARNHSIFFASGSKDHEVRGDGNGSFLQRGYYFQDASGLLHGPYVNKRIAAKIRDDSVLNGHADRQVAALAAAPAREPGE